MRNRALKKTLKIELYACLMDVFNRVVKSLVIDLRDIVKTNQLNTPEQLTFALDIFNKARDNWLIEIYRVHSDFTRRLGDYKEPYNLEGFAREKLKELRELPIKACMPRNVNYVTMEETLGYVEPWPKFWISLNWDEE